MHTNNKYVCFDNICWKILKFRNLRQSFQKFGTKIDVMLNESISITGINPLDWLNQLVDLNNI